MWPFRKRVDLVLDTEAGDDATASLVMILRYRGVDVAIDEVRRAIYPDGPGKPNALDVVHAAANFGLLCRGLAIGNTEALLLLPVPNIAHRLRTREPFPRPPGEHDGTFAVLERVAFDRVSLVDPSEGRQQLATDEFLMRASGIFLVFEDGKPPPRARVIAQ